jgi:glycosyltransferase involved in cell wall biosynthesis
MDQRVRAPEPDTPTEDQAPGRSRAALVDASAPGRPDDWPDTRVHVLQVIGNAIVGGMETWVERLLQRLPRQRFEVTALCPYESPYTDRLRALGLEVLIAPMPEDPLWTSIQMTAALVKARGIDLLHAHLPNAHMLAGLAGSLTGTPVVTTIHGRQLTTLDLEVHRAVGSHLSVVCHQSYFHALGLGADANRLSCETNGVDTQVFRPRTGRATALHSALGLPADTPLVGFVGRLSPEKGPEVFVRAALQLRSRCPAARCVIVGEGPMDAAMRQLIAQCGLEQHVLMAGPRSDMPALYNELDLLVSSSHSEAMPLAVMEAMASGLPVVATRVGGLPDMVEHGRTGWLVARNDFDDLAARCATLLADPGQRRQMGERARQRVVERMNLDDCVERVARLLARLAQPAQERSAHRRRGGPEHS